MEPLKFSTHTERAKDMSHCKACNTEYTERKDHNGRWVELCWLCYIPSIREAGYAQERPPHKVRSNIDNDSINSLVNDFLKTLTFHDWGEGCGIGPLSEKARIAHLETQAVARFCDAISLGYNYGGAVDKAIGKARFKRGL